MRGHIHDPLSFLAYIEIPGWPDQRFAADIFEKVMDTFLGDGGVVPGPFQQPAKYLGHRGQFLLQDGSDLITLGHDIIQHDPILFRLPERRLQNGKILWFDDHRLVRKYIESAVDRRLDILYLFLVVARKDHHIARLLPHHAR